MPKSVHTTVSFDCCQRRGGRHGITGAGAGPGLGQADQTAPAGCRQPPGRNTTSSRTAPGGNRGRAAGVRSAARSEAAARALARTGGRNSPLRPPTPGSSFENGGRRRTPPAQRGNPDAFRAPRCHRPSARVRGTGVQASSGKSRSGRKRRRYRAGNGDSQMPERHRPTGRGTPAGALRQTWTGLAFFNPGAPTNDSGGFTAMGLV